MSEQILVPDSYGRQVSLSMDSPIGVDTYYVRDIGNVLQFTLQVYPGKPQSLVYSTINSMSPHAAAFVSPATIQDQINSIQSEIAIVQSELTQIINIPIGPGQPEILP